MLLDSASHKHRSGHNDSCQRDEQEGEKGQQAQQVVPPSTSITSSGATIPSGRSVVAGQDAKGSEVGCATASDIRG